jgi:acetylornithine deacetylase/succinyl-diaminopimelate desuccinylase family protein
MKDVMTIASTLDVESLAVELIQIPSYSHMPRQEEMVADYIVRYFETLGIEVEKQMVEEGRPNVIAKIPGNGGPSIMFNGHIDTVPPYDMPDPFTCKIENGSLTGRGACDMKGPVAAMMTAMAAIKQSGATPGGDIYFSAVVDEEEKGIGIEALIQNWPAVDAVIVGEGTDLEICLGHKGLEWIKVDVTGKKTHSGNAKAGINAISMAGRFIAYFADEYEPVLDQRIHPILGQSSINIGTISGGDQPSTVADHCQLTIDRRFVPGETWEQVYRELVEGTEVMAARYPGFSAKVSNFFEEGELLPHLPFCIEEDRPIVAATKQTIKEQLHNEPVIRGLSAWTDAGMIHSQTNTDCIIFGPGSLNLAHTANESIPIDQLRQAVLLYIGIALHFCGGESKK